MVVVAQAEGLNFSEQTVDTIMTIYQGYPDEMGTSMYYDIVHQQPLEVEAIQVYFRFNKRLVIYREMLLECFKVLYLNDNVIHFKVKNMSTISSFIIRKMYMKTSRPYAMK